MSFSVKIQGWIAEKKIIEVGVCLQEKKKAIFKMYMESSINTEEIWSQRILPKHFIKSKQEKIHN